MEDVRPEDFVNDAANPETPDAVDNMTYTAPEEPKAAEETVKAAPEEPKPAEEAPRGYSYNPDPTVTYGEPSGPKAKKGVWKKVLAGVLACLLICGLAFGSGYLGVKAGYAKLEPVVITQVSDSNDSKEPNATTTVISTTGQLTSEQVAATVVPSVVAITTEQMTTSSFWGGSYVTGGAGSGVILSSDGYILTSAHVITGATSITVELQDGTKYPATVTGSYIDGDIAVIKIDATGLPAAKLGNSDNLVQGATVYAVGNPEGNFSGSITEGIVSALNRQISVSVETGESGNNGRGSYGSYYDYFFGSSYGTRTKTITLDVIQYDAAISPGNSGGGLFNAKGELVGIVCAKSSDTDSEGLSFAVPSNIALEVAQSLISTGSYTKGGTASSGENAETKNTNRAILGVQVVELTAEQAARYGFTNAGVYIAEVSAQTARDAGLQANDRIISVDGDMITTYDELKDSLAGHDPGDKVEVAVERSGKMFTCEVTLIENTNN
ncbi:MAG: trypsin-like peptidase domain-containing protein [Firmicutes bacterium]|nr:trypsin-like peptidase domain-containing protein [Bacillota bacterium]